MNFQHLSAVIAALELLPQPAFTMLRVEGSDDSVDYEAIDVDGQRLLVAQVKARGSRAQCTPQDVLEYLERWAGLDAPRATFRYITSASPSPTLPVRLLDPIRAAKHSGVTMGTPAPFTGLKQFPIEFLSRVDVWLSYGSREKLYFQAVSAVLGLHEHRTSAGLSDAERFIKDLFFEVSTRSEEADESKRVLHRNEIAALIGIRLDVLARSADWTSEVCAAYQERLVQSPRFVRSMTGDATSSFDVTATVLRLRHQSGAECSIESLIDTIRSTRSAAIFGAPGSGKSHALELLLRGTTAGQALAVLLDPVDYVEGSWRRRIHTFVSDIVGHDLSTSWLDVAMQQEAGVLIVVDGATELAQTSWEALERDLRGLVRDHRSLRICVAGRLRERLRCLQFPLFTVLDLEPKEQLRLIERHLSCEPTDAHRVWRKAQEHLGNMTTNPLLLELFVEGRHEDRGRLALAEIYNEYVERLWLRSGTRVSLQVLRIVAGRLALNLALDGEVALTRHAACYRLPAIVKELRDEGVLGEGQSVALEHLEQAGLVVSSTQSVGFAHDSLRDFLAACESEAKRTVPEVPSHVLDELVRYLPLDVSWPSLELHVAQRSIVAAARLASLAPASGEDSMLTRAAHYFAALDPSLATSKPAAFFGARFQAGMYIARVDGSADTSRFVAAQVFEAAWESARGAVYVSDELSALHLAVQFWLQDQRESLRLERRRADDRARSAAELSRLESGRLLTEVQDYGAACIGALARALSSMSAGIVQQVSTAVNWRGFSATLSPVQQTSYLGGCIKERPMMYRFDGACIEYGNVPPLAPHPWVTTTVEDFLQHPASWRALDAIETALAQLIEGSR